MNNVSLVFQRALNTAGIRPQMPPPTAPAINITNISRPDGMLSAQNSAKYDANIAPIRICPSAPIFQNRILNAGASASAVPRSGIAIFSIPILAVPVARDPFAISAYTVKGLCPSASISRPPVISASNTDERRIIHAFPRAISPRLTMRIRASFLSCFSRAIMPSPLLRNAES